MGCPRIAAAGVLSLLAVFLTALDAQQHREVFCDAREREDCIPDSLEIVFVDNGFSLLELPSFEVGRRIDVTVVLHTVTEKLQGWAYAVSHDPGVVRLVPESVTIDGTNAGRLFDVGFNATFGVGPDDDERRDPPEHGFISAVVLSFVRDVSLPVFERNTVARVTYETVSDPGREGTWLRFEHEVIANKGSPPVSINITASGSARFPRTLAHGILRRAPPDPAPFMRGDVDGNCALDIADAISIVGVLFGLSRQPFDCSDLLDSDDDGRLRLSDAVTVLEYLFAGGPPLPEPFHECGGDPTSEDYLACVEESPACP